MPYIDTALDLTNELTKNLIPDAETAKMAIIRPTSHFAIVTEDNPDMVRTLKLQHEFVEGELAKIIPPLSVEAEGQKRRELERAFQEPITKRAAEEQASLIERLKQANIPILFLVEDKAKLTNTSDLDYYTDQIFATDTGQYCDVNGELVFIPSSFKNTQRQGEERLAIAQAQNLDARIYPLLTSEGKPLTFEGGDIRQMPGKKLFFIGQGHRSDAETSLAIAKITNYYVLPIKLLQKQFYHLDCCFLPLPNDSAVIYEGEYQKDAAGKVILNANSWPELVPGTETMDTESRALIRTIYGTDKLVLISKAEALAFATNAAVLQDKNRHFHMFVNGERQASKPVEWTFISMLTSPILQLLSAIKSSEEDNAIADHRISFTRAHLTEIKEVTAGHMDIVEVPYKTMHGSGGSVRCTVQEVAGNREALRLQSVNKFFFSDRAFLLEKQLEQQERLKSNPRASFLRTSSILNLEEKSESSSFLLKKQLERQERLKSNSKASSLRKSSTLSFWNTMTKAHPIESLVSFIEGETEVFFSAKNIFNF